MRWSSAPLCLTVWLCSCAMGVYQGSVSSVSLKPIPPGLTFAVATSYDVTGKGPAPTATELVVRKLITNAMMARGYHPVPLAKRPSLVVNYAYGADLPSQTGYRRHLAISVIEIPPRGSNQKPNTVWQSELNSVGRSLDVIQLAEVVVPQAFKHFNQTVQRDQFAIARPELELPNYAVGLTGHGGTGRSSSAQDLLSGSLGYTQDAYGLGLHSDAYGRPFRFEANDGSQVFGPVNVNGYGLGVHQDQFGRPVRAVVQ